MKAMQLLSPGPIESSPLRQIDAPLPEPGQNQVRLRVRACGVCHTDLHILEGEVAAGKLPLVLGHQIVGVVDKLGAGARGFEAGERAGIAWLHRTCGRCGFCRSGQENLCQGAEFTGRDADGGFAEFAIADSDFVYRLPEGYGDVEAAPLLCAGIIGYRALRRCRIEPGGRLGLYGFGASAHIAIQVARHWGCEVFVFTRTPGHQELARELGAAWVGRAEDKAPAKLDAAVIFAPSGAIVPLVLEALERGGTLALAGIHMSPIPELDYALHLYHERTLTSVANATREDGREFLELVQRARIRTRTRTFPLAEANRVLQMLKESRIEGCAVLQP